MVERRQHKRIQCELHTTIDRTLSGRRQEHLEFMSESLSCGGVFILSEDLSQFTLGEQVRIEIRDGADRYFEGAARIVRSARSFAEDKKVERSGFGLMFIDPPPEFLTRIGAHVEKHNPVIL
jgi:c-di-GMP-binding flagellar brake protein YcgR